MVEPTLLAIAFAPPALMWLAWAFCELTDELETFASQVMLMDLEGSNQSIPLFYR